MPHSQMILGKKFFVKHFTRPVFWGTHFRNSSLLFLLPTIKERERGGWGRRGGGSQEQTGCSENSDNMI